MSENIFFKRKNEEELISLDNEKLKEWLKSKYEYSFIFIPDGYDVAFILLEEGETPLFDKWKILFYKESMDFSSNVKAITLDNVNDFDDGEELSYQTLKEIDCNFETVLDISRELIEKYRDN